ncbi:hypothetical protein ANCCAN_13816 [Ancylostoma caninum]|uniref:Uncharacterized protein n=1 Tax=Ancylostoma caninum TaxID=29170 RepID=A0A368GAD2_ANCCA|nr:hypothetical protein ANCCAN_13816 [Ancylostoma caninum]
MTHVLVLLFWIAAIGSVPSAFVPKVHTEVTNLFEELTLQYNEHYFKTAMENIKKQNNKTVSDTLRRMIEEQFLKNTFSMTLRSIVADGLSLSDGTIFAASFFLSNFLISQTIYSSASSVERNTVSRSAVNLHSQDHIYD